MPKLVVGNLVIGERFIEPSGPVIMKNIDTGDTCEMVYKSRGTWSTPEKDRNAVSAVVKNEKGEIRFTLEGRYTTEIIGTDVKNQSTWQLYKHKDLPQGQQDKTKIYGFNSLALQMNAMSDKLKQKLPPTDSRLRPDLRNWEQANLTDATFHQRRLEANQRARRALLKEKFKNDPSINISDERTFYNP